MSENTNPNLDFRGINKKGRCAKNENNQFIYEKFEKMKRASEARGNMNGYHCYNKILKTLEKYPMPILSAQQAIQLEGIGAKMAALIGNMVQKKHSQHLEDPEAPYQLTFSQQSDLQVESVSTQDILQDYNQHSQDADLVRRMRGFENLFDNSPIKEMEQESGEYISSQTSNYVSYAEFKNIWEPIKRIRDEEYSNDNLGMTLKKSKTMEPNFEYNQQFPSSSYKKNGLTLTSSRSTDLDDIGLKSKSTKKRKNYRPDKGSTNAFILIGLLAFETESKKKYATKKEIKTYLKKAVDSLGPMEIKNWSTMGTLVKNELVLPFNFNDEEKYSLTDEGQRVATDLQLEQLQVFRDSKSNSLQETSNTTEVSSNPFTLRREETKDTETTAASLTDDFPPFPFSNNPRRNELEDVEEEIMTFSQIERAFSRSQSQTFKPSQSLLRREKLKEKIEDRAAESNGPAIHKILKNTIKKLEVVLYVDNREVKNQKERNYVYDKIAAAGINCKSVPLPVGDFLWVVNIEGTQCNQTFTLDYIIERKTADDLAASIMDNRYNQQKFRLTNSKIKNVFYVVEGKASQNAVLRQNALETAILNTQILNGFKVRTTVNLQETIRFISSMHYSIEATLLKELTQTEKETLDFQYNYDEFELLTSKSNCLNTRILFGNMMRHVKGCGKEAVADILEKFDTFYEFYRHINSKPDETARLEFLGQKQKKGKKAKGILEVVDPLQVNVNKTVAAHINTLFYETKYPKVLSKDTQKFHEDSSQV